MSSGALRKQHLQISLGSNLQMEPFQRAEKPRKPLAPSRSVGGASHGLRAYFHPHCEQRCEQSTTAAGAGSCSFHVCSTSG